MILFSILVIANNQIILANNSEYFNQKLEIQYEDKKTSSNQINSTIGNYEYYVSEDKLSWNDVQKLCKANGNGWFIPNKRQLLILIQALNLGNEKVIWTSEEGISNPSITYGGMYNYDVAVALDLKLKESVNFYKTDLAHYILARSLGNNLSNVKTKINTAYALDNLLVSKEELRLVNYNEALSICSSIGEGWRLPTIEELEKIKSNGRNSVSDLDYNLYFSSTRTCDNCFDSYYCYNMVTGKREVNDKSSKLRVIPVYSKPKESIKTWKFSQYEVIPQFYGPMTLNEAQSYCLNMTDNPNRKWRIANMQELSSMLQYKNEISGIVGKTFMSYTPGKSRSDSRQDLEILDIAPIGQAESYWMTGNAEKKYYFFIVR